MSNEYYLTLNNELIWKNEDKSLVDRLFFTSFDRKEDKSITLHKYMKRVSRRCKLYNKSVIRIDTSDNFIGDLIENGFITKVKLN